MLTQTFALADLVALERAGFHVEIFTLRKRADTVQQPEVKMFQDRIHHAPLCSWAFVRANLQAWGCPVTWRLFVEIVAGTLARPAELFKTLIVFPQAIYFADFLRHTGTHHIHAAWASYPATMAWVISELVGLPFSFSAHAYDIYMVRSLLKQKIERARFVVTCAETNRQALICMGGKESGTKIHLHRHGVDLERFASQATPSRKPDGGWQILACGNYYPYKGFEYLVSACGLLRDRGYSFECTIVGHGVEKTRLEQQIQRLGLDAVVRLVPPMLQPQLALRYRQADLFVHPAVIAKNGDRDVIPNVLVEAMASGVPVVSTSLAGIQELVQDGVNGVLVSPGDPQALVEAMISLMQNCQKREKLVKAAKQSVTEAYDRHKNAEGFIQTFRAHIAF
jgi:glycosyltransferase involved in cell wall biosynthesis